MGDQQQQIRVEELLVFRPDRTGINQVEAALSQFDKKLKDVVAQTGGLAKEQQRQISDVVKSMMVITKGDEERAHALLGQVAQLREQGMNYQGITGELRKEVDLNDKQVNAVMNIVRENEKILDIHKEQQNKVREILGIKRDEIDLTGKSKEEIDGITQKLGLNSHMLLFANQLIAKGGREYAAGGLQLARQKTIMESLSKTTGLWLANLAKGGGIYKALAAATYAVGRNMFMSTAYAELLSQHVQSTETAMLTTGEVMGSLQQRFGLSEEKAGDFTKQLGEAGLQANEIAKYATVIYAREMMWNISAEKQVEIMRNIEYTMKLTGDEANDFLNRAGSIGKELKAWTIAEVVDEVTDMSKQIRAAGGSTLGMFALFKAIAATDVTKGFNAFAGLSKETRKGIMGSVAAFGEMSEAQLAVVAQMYKFPPEIKTMAEKIVYLREAFFGLVPGMKPATAMAAALGADFDFIGEKVKNISNLGEKKLRVSLLLEELLPNMQDVAMRTDIAQKIAPYLGTGLSYQEAIKSLTETQLKALEDQRPDSQKIVESATSISMKMGGLLDWGHRLTGIITEYIAFTRGGREAVDMKTAIDTYGQKGIVVNEKYGALFNKATGHWEALTARMVPILKMAGLYTPETTTHETVTGKDLAEISKVRATAAVTPGPEVGGDYTYASLPPEELVPTTAETEMKNAGIQAEQAAIAAVMKKQGKLTPTQRQWIYASLKQEYEEGGSPLFDTETHVTVSHTTTHHRKKVREAALDATANNGNLKKSRADKNASAPAQSSKAGM